MDILFIGEPYLWGPKTHLGCANNPNFRRVTPLYQNTKVVGYLNVRHPLRRELAGS